MDPELKATIDKLQAAWASFRERTDSRSSELESALREIRSAQAVLELTDRSSGSRAPAVDRNLLASFGSWTRTGDLGALQNAAKISSDPDGGLFVPREISREVERLVTDRSAMRRIARVRQASSSPLVVPVDQRGTGSGWVGETEARPETDSPRLASVEIHAREIFASPRITQQLLDLTPDLDAAAWLTEGVAEEFSDRQGEAFVSGDGVKRPRGFLTHPTSLLPDATRPWGTIQHVATGNASGFAAASATVSPADALVDVVHSLRAAYRRGAAWLMNSATAAVVRKLKDADGRFVWSPSLQEGQPPLLLGFPVHEDEAMPDVAADALPVAFGSWRRAYHVVDFGDAGTRILRDPFTAKPWVSFYATAYVGGSVVNFEALKLLKVSA